MPTLMALMAARKPRMAGMVLSGSKFVPIIFGGGCTKKEMLNCKKCKNLAFLDP